MTAVQASPPRDEAQDRTCPFVGLLPYSNEDEAWFFGRETDARLIAENLKAYELTVLYGPSGVGKSSVMNAGVLPELHRHADHERALGRSPSVSVLHRQWQSDPVGGLVRSISSAVREQTAHGSWSRSNCSGRSALPRPTGPCRSARPQPRAHRHGRADGRRDRRLLGGGAVELRREESRGRLQDVIRPAQLKQAVSFYEEPARRMLESSGSVRKSMFEEHFDVPQTRSEIS